ncbi:MAG: Maf family protein [Solirubrobacteraceae bacterium]
MRESEHAPLPLVLASASPQRSAILARIGLELELRPTGAQELEHGEPGEVALQNALLKARAAHRPGAREAVLAADTLVALDGTIYGKPADEAAARRTLEALGGRTHEVHTGVALLIEGEERTALSSTAVTFRPLTEQLLARCLASGQWREKSGAYAIQGFGAALVTRLDGDYENVVGLPVATLLDLWPELLSRVCWDVPESR